MNLPLIDFLQAQQRIRPYIKHTDIIHSPFLSQKAGGEVWLKLENQQPTGSFKVRGALNKISRMTPDERARGIVAASAGNHALGVAYAVHALGGGIAAHIFVPETAPQAKVEKLRRFPVTVQQTGATYEAAHQAAAEFARRTGAVEISAYDDLDVIAGQGSVALEIFTQLPQVDVICVPVGGGGLLAGVTAVSRTINPACHIIGMQPAASPAAQLSLQQGAAIDPYDHAPTIADGLAGGFGRVPFEVIRPFPPDIHLTDEKELRIAIYTLVQQHQLIIEPSGAIAIAAILHGTLQLAGKTAVCVLTGGNLDTKRLLAVLQEFES